MTVSNYLEAFLSVYGWAVYYTFFLLIGVTGLFLYPLLRALLTILTEYLSGEGYDGIGYLKQAFVILALNMLVFFLALVPVARISFDKTEVRDICDTAKHSVEEINALNAHEGKKYFTLSDARVPLLPWLAMRLGQGFNSVVYKQLPCALHTADANKTVLGLETGDEVLDQEFAAFIDQCHRPAVNKIKEILDGNYDQQIEGRGKISDWFKEELKKEAKKRYGGAGYYFTFDSTIEEELINFVDSKFIIDYLYNYQSPLVTGPYSNELGGIVRSMRAQKSVAAFQDVEEGLPSCYTWWTHAGKGLRKRLVTSLSDDAVLKIAKNHNIPGCVLDINPAVLSGSYTGQPVQGVKNKEQCLAIIRERLASGSYNPTSDEAGDGDVNETGRGLARNILLAYQGNKVHEKEGLLQADENAVFSVFTLAGAAAIYYLKAFGVDLAGGALSAITSFYASIYMLKIMLRFLVPMIIMVIYMFWGVYVLIGEMRGSTVVKGMLTIFSATIIFGLWSIADHIDDKLWDAMYGSRWGSPFAMILLDATSGIFYIIIFSAVFYMVNLAGGGDAGGMLGGGKQQASSLSRDIGGRTTGRSFGIGSWLFSGAKNNKGEYTGGWGRQWAGKGWEKVKSTSGKIAFNIKESYQGVKSRLAGLRNKE
ncbi:hypothetical protein [uncultured Cardiobacterium sp.]|uniref:hypothetical protein n=1 Tax=uncultured Cardiobacterium sp. TaxID=417619 RepID=UPI00261B3EBA|nr:hypothetical protein [uncultured Cardiobacterium sp.]